MLVLKGYIGKGRVRFTDRSLLKLRRYIEHHAMKDKGNNRYMVVTFDSPQDVRTYQKFYFGALLPELIDQVGEFKPILDTQLRETFGFGQDLKNYTVEQWRAFIMSIINFFELEI